MKDLDLEHIKKAAKANTKKADLARRTTTANGIFFSAEDRAFSRKLPQTWNLTIETSSITNQKISGRCWLFASLNHLRHNVERDFKIKTFELSQTYNYFYDKLEKSNVFLELAWKYRGEKLSSRLNGIFSHPQTDGGYWQEAAALVDKYGVVPQSVMPESENASDSRNLNQILDRVLRKGGLKIRDCKNRAQMESLKGAILADVYRILSISLGEPPKNFSWSYESSDDKKSDKPKIHKFRGTPQEFAKKFGLADLREKYVSLANRPTLKYGKVYAEKDDWAITGDHVPELNLKTSDLKPLIVKQLREKESVLFTGESRRDMAGKNQGVMDPEVFDVSNLFDVDFTISQKDRARSHEDLSDHEMLIVAADTAKRAGEDFARFYKVENSWGKDVGDGGFWVMSDAWVNEYLESVVIRKDLLPENIAAMLTQEPIYIYGWEEWDPEQ